MRFFARLGGRRRRALSREAADELFRGDSPRCHSALAGKTRIFGSEMVEASGGKGHAIANAIQEIGSEFRRGQADPGNGFSSRAASVFRAAMPSFGESIAQVLGGGWRLR